MKQYSPDLRERRLRAFDAGLSIAEASRLCGVGPTTITRWRYQRRATRSLVPRPRPGRPPRLTRDQWPALAAQVAARAAPLAEHCERWARAHGAMVSVATMSRLLRKLE